MKWAIPVLIFTASTVCMGQQGETPKSAPPEQTAPARDAPTTKEDLAVPLCPAKFNDSPLTNGVVAIGDKGVTLPTAKHSVEARPPDEAKVPKGKHHVRHFESEISLVVDTNGKPQGLCVAKSAGHDLDAKAAEAIQQYEFDPAKKDGKPVAVRLTIDIQFHLY